MRKSDQPLEPSIEEILASIRKIIADDSVQPRDQDAQPFVADAVPELPPRIPPQPAVFARFQEKRGFEPPAPAEPASEDDIIELTEDIILEDQSGQDNPHYTEFASDPADPFLDPSAEEDAAVELQRRNAKLEDVFSNVAAEVERLSQGHGLKPESGAPADADDWDQPAHVRQAVETYAAARPQVKPVQETPFEGEPEPALPFAPRVVPTTPAPAASAAPARPQSRPVWSARHLEHEGPRSRKAKDVPETPAPPAGQPAARQPADVPRDNWADGVQMPVPESGPAVPFAAAPDADLMPEPAAAGAPSAIEKEKEYVGGVLTRVFGRSQKKEAEEPSAAPAEPASKAEKLAKTTISDFAAQKLRAPAIAEVLQADKPFMEAITGSLESALANIETGGKKPAAPSEPAKDKPMMEAQPAPYEELPDALLPFDSEFAPFAPGVPGFLKDSIAARQQPAAAKPVAEKPAAAPEPRARAADMPAAPEQPDAAAVRDEPAPAPASLPAVANAEPAAALSVMPAGLEESIKELIKPLIIQWLNDNLPRIVENAVRDELAGHGGLAAFRREGSVRR